MTSQYTKEVHIGTNKRMLQYIKATVQFSVSAYVSIICQEQQELPLDVSLFSVEGIFLLPQ